MTAPLVIVSSRDGADVPRVAGAVRLAAVAEAHGWTVRQTYALARVPDRYHLNGNLAKSAHVVETVAVRMWRGQYRAVAVWHDEGGGWRYLNGLIGGRPCGARALTQRLRHP